MLMGERCKSSNITLIPILNVGPWVLTAAHTDHEQSEHKEETCHSHTDTVDGQIAHKHAAIYQIVDGDLWNWDVRVCSRERVNRYV